MRGESTTSASAPKRTATTTTTASTVSTTKKQRHDADPTTAMCAPAQHQFALDHRWGIKATIQYAATHYSKKEFYEWVLQQPSTLMGCMLVRRGLPKRAVDDGETYRRAPLWYRSKNNGTYDVYIINVPSYPHEKFLQDLRKQIDNFVCANADALDSEVCSAGTQVQHERNGDILEPDIVVQAREQIGSNSFRHPPTLLVVQMEWRHRKPYHLGQHCLLLFKNPHLRKFVGARMNRRRGSHGWAAFFFVVSRDRRTDANPNPPLVLRQFVSCGTEPLKGGSARRLMEGLRTPVDNHGVDVVLDDVAMDPDMVTRAVGVGGVVDFLATQPIRREMVETDGPDPPPAVAAVLPTAAEQAEYVRHYKREHATLAWHGCAPGVADLASTAIPVGADRTKYILLEPQDVSFDPDGTFVDKHLVSVRTCLQRAVQYT